MQSQINRIKDVLRTDSWISWALGYTEQVSWILFLKFLDDFETRESDSAELDGKEYKYIVDEKFRWNSWINQQRWYIAWSDLKEFVNLELFPYLKSFKWSDADYHSIKYKIGEIFYFINNKIEDGNNLREVVDIIDKLNFQNQKDLFELSKVYEDLLQDMGNAGGNNGEFYTPRCLIKLIVDLVDPQVGQTVYDPAAGSCGFLIEAFNHIKPQVKTDKELDFLNHKTFFGNEKTPLAYIMWVMNMILHGISAPNITKADTLATTIKDIQEKDRHDIILANPPFGWKIKEQVQINFPFRTNATEMLFMQHIYKMLKVGWKAGIIVPEWVLFSTSESFKNVKKEILENYNLHTIISLPGWVFLPYAGVKTNILLFDRVGSTRDIWYYEIDLGRTLTKNKPIKYDELSDIVWLCRERKDTPKSWIVKVGDIRDYDLSAKNPNKAKEEALESPDAILGNIEQRNSIIHWLMSELRGIISK